MQCQADDGFTVSIPLLIGTDVANCTLMHIPLIYNKQCMSTILVIIHSYRLLTLKLSKMDSFDGSRTDDEHEGAISSNRHHIMVHRNYNVVLNQRWNICTPLSCCKNIGPYL